jgi:DNA-binding SARP family transcriptional activator
MLSLEPAEVDVAAFERLVGEGSAGSLEAAAALYRGEFLEDLHVNEVAFQDWVVGERERLRELAVEALARLLQHQCRSSVVEPAIQTALRLLRLDRTQEVVHRTLIRLYARQGRRAEALRQYRACVGVLRGELGVEPEPETVRLRRELLKPRPAVRTAASEA